MTQLQFNNALLGLNDKLQFYALSLTADPEKANDLLQETLLKALLARKKFTPNSNFRAWIYTIMKNTFINDYRRMIRTKNTFDDSNNEACYAFAENKVYPSPDSSCHSKEIMGSIEILKDKYRLPFTMFLDGYKYNEIADKLGMPLGTVKSRIFLTRKKLSEVWAD